MDERFRDALRRNALLSGVLAEGYLPSADAALRARLRSELTRSRRRWAWVVAAAVLFVAPLRPPPDVAPAPAVAPALLEIVHTDVTLEIARTPEVATFEIVRTPALLFERVGDEELLRSPGVVALVGHPGGPRRVVYSSTQ